MGGFVQLPEYSSTIDPSHIIHLIRQLLPVKAAAADSSSLDGSGGVQLLEDALKVKEACIPEKVELLEGKAECGGVVSEETVTEDVAARGEREEAVTDPGRCVGDAAGCCREEGDGKGAHDRDNGGEDTGGAVSGEDDVGEDACKEEALQKSAGLSDPEELREEAGCVLWDLAASESQAEFLVSLIFNNILPQPKP